MNTILKVNDGLDVMVNDYFNRTGKVSIDCEILAEDGKGFISYAIAGDKLLVPDLYGDGKYWLEKALEFARQNGCTKLIGGTRRNPKAYEKMFGTKVVGYILEREV